jgi:hypothetical protein
VRIIPYDQPMSDLPRIGTAPTFPQRDTRSYAQPIETPALLKTFAGQVRFDTTLKGVAFTAASGPITLKSDRVSQMLLGNLASHAATLPAATAIDFTQDAVHYAVTAAECTSMFNAVNTFVQTCRTAEAQCLTDLNSPTPTILTYADVEAKFSGL